MMYEAFQRHIDAFRSSPEAKIFSNTAGRGLGREAPLHSHVDEELPPTISMAAAIPPPAKCSPLTDEVFIRYAAAQHLS